MNAAAPWTRVLMAPWQQRRNQGAMWPSGLLLAVVGVLALGLVAILPPRPAAALAVTVLSVPLFGGWAMLVLGLLQQNRPTAARLVPRQLGTLRRVLFGAWLAFTLLAALVGWAFGHAWSVAAGAALLLLLLMWAVRFPVLGLFLWLIPAASVQWIDTPFVLAALRSFSAAGQGRPDGFVLVTAAALLAGALASSFLLLRGGDARHAQAYDRRVKQRAARCSGSGTGTPGWRRTGNGATGVYRRWLAHAATQRTGAVLPRALLGLGPRIHWTGTIGQLPGVGLVVAVAMLILWQIDAATDPIAAWGLSIGVLTFATDIALKARAAIHATRHEQALLMLLPGMPRGRALNRALARRLSVQFVCSWGLGVLACAVALPLGEQVGWFAIYAAACLPFGALLWTDWSRIEAPTAASAVVPPLVLMPLALGAIAAHARLGVPAWVGVLCFVAAAVLLVAWRARRLADAPSAFPAGRLA